MKFQLTIEVSDEFLSKEYPNGYLEDLEQMRKDILEQSPEGTIVDVQIIP